MEAVSADGTRIHYKVVGDGPTVLLAHGSLMQGASWAEAGYLDALGNFRCVVLDCRGYGSSDKPHEPEAYATERYVQDLLAVADAAGADRFGVAGYSWGTAGAWRAAAENPDRVAALVAIGGWHPNLYSFDAEIMERTRIEPMKNMGVEGIAEFMKAAEGPLPEWWERQVLACDPDAYIAQRYAAVDWARTSPTDVTVPTLLISGADEDTAKDSNLIAGVLDDGEAVIVEGRGHCQNFLASETIEGTRTFLTQRYLNDP
jgi:pimeloyl-ACP methyl ester carboxylesterase